MDYEYSSVFIDGAFRPSRSAERLEAINPSTEEVFGYAPDATVEEVDAAVRSARRAFRESGWAQSAPVERAKLLRRLADILIAKQDEIAAAITAENGMVLAKSKAFNVYGAALRYSYFAELIENWQPEEIRSAFAPASLAGERSGKASLDAMTSEAYTIVRQEPVGVVGIIVPWNVPLLAIAVKLGAALAAGCTAVIKPSPETSLDSVLFAEAVIAAGFPAGVVNIVTGGDEVGKAIVAHPDVNMIAFTGSSAVGRDVARNCGGALKRVTLELGGKSAAIVLDDADLDVFAAALPACSMGGYSGQSCRASTRILASRARYNDVLQAVVGTLSAMPVGDPLDPNTVVGPLVSRNQRDRVEGYISLGQSEGATLALGGGRPRALNRGFYIEPTVFSNVNNSMRIAREEIFGPVLVVIPYENEEEAIAIANDSEYGLGGTVFTRDVERGTDIARRVETGTVGINSGGMISLRAPFGGVKASGLGREMGPEGFHEYLVSKSIVRY